MEKKYTKKDNYAIIRNMIETTNMDNETQDRLLAFIDHEVELMNQRAEKSKQYQKEHKATNDDMTDAIIETLGETSTAMCVADLAGKIIDATPQKLVYRLGQLFKNGTIVKETQTIKTDSGSRKITYYKMAE